MDREGPSLELLLHRIAETPADFCGEPRIGAKGNLHVSAIVGDLARLLGTELPEAVLERIGTATARSERNRLAVALLACWLLADDWFQRARPSTEQLIALLDTGVRELAEGTVSVRFMSDPDRREELARVALAGLGYRPAGETTAQAQDRLSSLSAAERKRVMKAAREAEQRSREIRQQLAEAAAKEAADKWTRE